MPLETERKFLVPGDGWRVDEPKRLSQGYLNLDKSRTVRVRISGSDAFLTVKGPTTGASRSEFEYPIPVPDAEEMLKLCELPPVEKFRHIVHFQGHDWEVDEFLGENKGLIVAEIELSSEDESFELPPWIGEEVTHDKRYFNSSLSVTPFCRW